MRPTRLDPSYKYRASPGGLDKGGSKGGVSEDKLGRMPTAAAAELYSNSTLFVPATLYTVQLVIQRGDDKKLPMPSNLHWLLLCDPHLFGTFLNWS